MVLILLEKTRIPGWFGKGIKYRFWANFTDYCQNSLNFNKAIEVSKDVLHEALNDINNIDTAAHCIGGHMQTHAHIWGRRIQLLSYEIPSMRFRKTQKKITFSNRQIYGIFKIVGDNNG
jgi:poly(3-hydroxyalkanoate) synthetase